MGNTGLDRDARHEGDADPRCHHLHERVQAAGLELRPRLSVPGTADIQRVTTQAVPFFEQHERFALEHLERDRFGTGECMGLVAGEQELVLKEILDSKVPGAAGERDERGIHLAVLQPSEQWGGLLLAQVDCKSGKPLPQRWQDAREQERADGRDHAEAHLPGHGSAVCHGDLHHLLRLAQQRFCPQCNGCADAGHEHVPVRAFGEGRPENRFQVANAGA